MKKKLKDISEIMFEIMLQRDIYWKIYGNFLYEVIRDKEGMIIELKIPNREEIFKIINKKE